MRSAALKTADLALVSDNGAFVAGAAIAGQRYQCEASYISGLKRDVLARTLYGEALRLRSSFDANSDLDDLRRFMQAVASVAQNRLHLANKGEVLWWGRDLVSICQNTSQFECWKRCYSGKSSVYQTMIEARLSGDVIFQMAMQIARNTIEAAANELSSKSNMSPLKNATHYCSKSQSPLPLWAHSMKVKAHIGGVLFYG